MSGQSGFDPERELPVRPEFRRTLREGFVTGELADAETRSHIEEDCRIYEGMVQSSSSDPERPFGDVLSNSALAQEPVPSARMRFQLTLKAKFASGAIASKAVLPKAVAPKLAAAPRLGPKAIPEPAGVPRPKRAGGERRRAASKEAPDRPLWRKKGLWIPVLATAAAAFVVLLGPGMFGTEIPGGQDTTDEVARSWTARVGSMWEAVRVDGQPLDIVGGDLASFSSALAGANSVSFGSSEVELELEEEGIYMAILPNTVLERMPFQEHKRSDPLTLHLASGEVFVTTEKGSGPHDIRIFTPEYEVRVTGTTLGVMCGESATCVCVAEGSVQVREQATDSSTATEWMLVGEGSSLLFRDQPGGVQRYLIPHESGFTAAPDPEHFAEHVDDLQQFHTKGTRKK